MKAATREGTRRKLPLLASDPTAISSGALGIGTGLLEQNPSEKKYGAVRHYELSGMSHLMVS